MSATIRALELFAHTTPHAPALASDGAPVSYNDLLAKVRTAADALRSADIRTIALLADNSADWIVADLAAQLAGVVVVPVPGFFSPQQIRHAIRGSGAEAVLLDHSTRALTSALPLTSVGHLTERLEWFRPSIDIAEAKIAAATSKISYTSGTTGEPKGVCLSQAAMDAVADSLAIATEDLGLRRHLCVLPLALLLENVAGVYGSLRDGGEICVPGLASLGWSGAAKLDANRLLERIDEYAPDSIILVPQMLQSILDLLERGALAPTSLKFVAVGGGHVAPALLQRADSLGLPVYEGYGLTETASVVAMSSPKQRRPGSVGRPLAHSRVRIGANGEVLVSGAGFSGYVGQPHPSEAEVATGDIGRLDEDGFLFIQGRTKNVYITSFGRNVSPEWIEAEIVKQPSIAQVAVFGESRPWSVAVVVPAPGANARDVDADIADVNDKLPDYARVGEWIAAAGPFTPSNGLLTANGRNRRNAIWDRYAGQVNACYDNYVSLRA